MTTKEEAYDLQRQDDTTRESLHSASLLYLFAAVLICIHNNSKIIRTNYEEQQIISLH